MKTTQVLFLFIALGFLSACTLFRNTDKINPPPAFRQFLNKFKPLDLPLVFGAGTKENGSTQLDLNSSDTLFVKFKWGIGLFYGMLPDTSNYYGLIILVPADDLVPVLKTFDKSGNPIDEMNLMVNGCGGGSPVIEYCSSTGIINRDLSIYCADTLRTIDVDSNIMAIEGSGKYYYIYKSGRLNGDGKITVGKEQYQEIK